MFIVLEGGEGVGKTSQIKLLTKELKLRKIPFIVTKEPGKMIKRMLFKKDMSPMVELFLFLADRKNHIDEVIKPALNDHKIVICDRFSLSTIAYQGYGRGIDLGFIERLNREVSSGIIPDITFLIDVAPEETLWRKKREDRFEREDMLFHKKVREGYLFLAKKDKKIRVIDGRKTKEEIHKEIMDILIPMLK